MSEHETTSSPDSKSRLWVIVACERLCLMHFHLFCTNLQDVMALPVGVDPPKPAQVRFRLWLTQLMISILNPSKSKSLLYHVSTHFKMGLGGLEMWLLEKWFLAILQISVPSNKRVILVTLSWLLTQHPVRHLRQHLLCRRCHHDFNCWNSCFRPKTSCNYADRFSCATVCLWKFGAVSLTETIQ